MAENVDTQQPIPNPDLKSFDRLIGTWKQSGGVEGESTYEWAEGGFFLMQHVDFVHAGHKIKGVEIIGHEQELGLSQARISSPASIVF